MKSYTNKLFYLFVTVFIFSVTYSVINPVNFHGINKIQDQIKDNLIEDKAREGFYSLSNKDRVELDVEKIVEKEDEKIHEQGIFQRYLDCLYFSIITSCLLGYGDIYPITAGGKIFSSVIVFISLGVVAVPAGLIASAFSDIFKNKE